MAVTMYADPADDWDRYCANEPAIPAPLRLCVKCRDYVPPERATGERDGGYLCDQCERKDMTP